MTPMIPDIVQDSKLETHFHSDPEHVQHIHYVSGSTPRQRKIRKEERWRRERWLGRGGYGTVESQLCIQGDSKGKLRAVKKMQKLASSDYYRELEAIALFSHNKYERCFVKSLGWYDDTDNIYITMEYFPDGDLEKFLSSPLPEIEGQRIVSQILEGLNFMHDKGFAHRDLKPANILVVYKGPDWWVKIADFGISKRATEGLTALRTHLGSPAFAAPEVLGFVQNGNESEDSYTNAVDIWSLGVITFLILTGETLFTNPRRLGRYVSGSFQFPLDVLHTNNVSEDGCEFVKQLMAAKSEDRPSAKACLQHMWLDSLIEDLADETRRTLIISNPPPPPLEYSDFEPSASWSTHEQISLFETQSAPTIEANSPKSLLSSQEYLNVESSATWGMQEKVSESETLSRPDMLAEQAMTSVKNPVSSISTSKPSSLIYWKQGKVLKGHSGSVTSVEFSPDGSQIASASFDNTIRLWDSTTGAVRHTLQGHSDSIWGVTFSPDGKHLASASADKTVRLWDPATGAALFILKGHSEQVYTVAFSPDGKQIASGSYDETARLWDSATGAAHHTLQGHTDIVWDVAFSPEGKQIASASEDKTIRLWDSVTGAARHTLQGHSDSVRGIAFSPDGKQIASASRDRTVRLWDSVTGAARQTLQDHSGSVRSVVFSPDGKLIASASYDKTVQLWDPASGAALFVLKGHSEQVYAVAFSPDGKHIASGSYDHTVRLWDLTEEPSVLRQLKKFFK